MQLWHDEGSTVRRWVVVAVLTLAGVALTCPPPPAQAADWQATAGAQSEDQGIQALAFLPIELTVNVGDSITWTFPTEEIHTVTFLCPTPPGSCTPTGRPPFATAPVTPDNFVYHGTEFVNSGTLIGGASYTVDFATPGTFSFVCLVHTQMTGTVHVQGVGTPYPFDQTAYDQQAQRQSRQLLVQGRQMKANEMQAAVAGPSHDQVTVGSGFVTVTSAGAQSVMIARFLPPNLEIQAGDTVTWTALDPATPHTVTFGPEPANPFPPAGLDGPGHATINAPTQAVNSGFMGLGPGRPGGTQLSVTFTKPGTYAYICALHDDLGMAGTIIVRP
jgi:plastocyanin